MSAPGIPGPEVRCAAVWGGCVQSTDLHRGWGPATQAPRLRQQVI